jgi:glycosyltransferase involved in cell wall biosynthesis
MKTKWPQRKAVIIIHQATTGPGHDLRDFLLEQKIDELLFIAHPLLYIKDNIKNSSRMTLYKKGKIIKEHTAFHFVLPEYILYIKDVIYSVFWSMRYAGNVDIVFGLGNINAFAGLIIKQFGFAKNSVYYVIDYIPQRFANKLVNSGYHFIEKISAEKSDYTWNLSPRMIEAREKKWNMNFPNQLIVPHGVHISRIKHVPLSKIHKYEIMYMGTLLKKQGVQLVLQAVKKISTKMKQIKFTIIGKGPYEMELKALTKKLKIEKYVTFLGYVESHKEMENRIAEAGIAVALYNKKYDEFSYYADPGKIKNYLGASVPVIMTDIPYIARQVEQSKCGFIVDYSQESLVNILMKYFSSDALIKQYRKNALSFAKKYDWDIVYNTAFKQMKLV